VRIVLDTNVVMSALLWRGNPYRLLQAIREHPNAQAFSSPVLLAELTDVLSRRAATAQFARIGRTAHAVLADYLEAVELVDPEPLPPVSRDPDDDHVLAAALAASADLIVSGDADLLVLKTFRDIPILTPAQAVERLTEHR
jgi:putative PIN family toxin of toxin-antitoxin system